MNGSRRGRPRTPNPDEAQRRALIEKAKTTLPPKIEHYAALMGVAPDAA